MAQDLMRNPRTSPTAPPSSQLVDRLRKERAEAKTAKQIAETKLNRVEPELNELRQRVDALQTAGLQVENERNEARSDSEAYQQRVATLTTELENERATIVTLRNSLPQGPQPQTGAPMADPQQFDIRKKSLPLDDLYLIWMSALRLVRPGRLKA
jgi:hypothetical protein